MDGSLAAEVTSNYSIRDNLDSTKLMSTMTELRDIDVLYNLTACSDRLACRVSYQDN